MREVFNVVYWIVCIGVNLFIVRLFVLHLYSSKEELLEGIKYLLTPDIISIFRGEYFKDRYSELKLSMIPILFICLMTMEAIIYNYLFVK